MSTAVVVLLSIGILANSAGIIFNSRSIIRLIEKQSSTFTVRIIDGVDPQAVGRQIEKILRERSS
jgi:hypothetical protein